ncbi:MAG: HAMP domain-containing histidine kinase [Ignavibacteriae bacterium]|nr:HAMP domain-containing histidine kinase [Ignavibacteriota bacterium]
MAIPRSANIKIGLLVTAVVIVLGTLYYTQNIVQQLLKKEREIAGLYARSLEFIANSPADQSDYGFIFTEVIGSIDFPMLLTDSLNIPLQPYHLNSRNIVFPESATEEEKLNHLTSIIKTLDEQNKPITVTIRLPFGDIVQYLHYGESEIVTKLRLLPIIEMIVGGVFIIIGYLGFSYIKRSEQGNIWVGMAKETAHQLGTPLSSLLGWIEMMKIHAANDTKQAEVVADMENDLQRLQKVTDRFSKIGSKPSFKEEDLHEVIESVIKYFQKRLPSRYGEGKHIDISIETTEHISCNINRELFEWVIENLIKNAVDAIEESKGKVTFSLAKKGNSIIIDAKDTGKGIEMSLKKDIFRPGYSTKKRGWGLGLSLSKRIIETYHKGKLFVKESKVGKGTTFRIKLHS